MVHRSIFSAFLFVCLLCFSVTNAVAQPFAQNPTQSEFHAEINRGMRLQLAGRNTLLVSSGLMVTAFAVGVATPLTTDERRQDLRRGVAYSAAGASVALLIPSITLLMRGRKIVQRAEEERFRNATFAPAIHRGGLGATFGLHF